MLESKYLKLLRLEDQYPSLASAFIAGMALPGKPLWILLWAVALTCLSISAFIVNEITDSKDTDKYSWNPDHIDVKNLDQRIIAALFFLFSVLGLFISFILGLIWWAIAIYALGVLYSLKPIRLKGIFALDLLTQFAVWALLPFLGPLWISGDFSKAAMVIIPLTLITASNFLPYQLADFKADKKSGLKNTHVVLGIQRSLKLGLTLGILGLLSFFGSRIFLYFRWSWAFLFFVLYVLYLYPKWLKKFKKYTPEFQEEMISFIKIAKPLSRLTTLILFFHFLLG